MDPLHTAYLDWRLLMRSLIACSLPALPTASVAQLLQLKQRMQQADSNADGLLTPAELLSVDMQPIFGPAASIALRDGSDSSADGPSDNHGSAIEGSSAQGEQSEIGASASAPYGTDEKVPTGGAISDKSGAQLIQLLCLMFEDTAGDIAALEIDDIMLYLCCDIDGAAGLQKAFAALTGSQYGRKVCYISFSLKLMRCQLTQHVEPS